MKEYYVKEGGRKYQIAENADDLNIVRYSALKNIITEESSGMKSPDLIQWFADRRTYYNQGDYYSLVVSEMNLVKEIEQNSKSKFNDTSHKIFALMVLEEGELPDQYDSTKQDEKLSRMCEEGLTQGEVWKQTEGFITASPILSGSFFLMSLAALSKQMSFSEPLAEQISKLRQQAESLIESKQKEK